jgi:hypothetical protein
MLEDEGEESMIGKVNKIDPSHCSLWSPLQDEAFQSHYFGDFCSKHLKKSKKFMMNDYGWWKKMFGISVISIIFHTIIFMFVLESSLSSASV